MSDGVPGSSTVPERIGGLIQKSGIIAPEV
jgi:hypothetical protein